MNHYIRIGRGWVPVLLVELTPVVINYWVFQCITAVLVLCIAWYWRRFRWAATWENRILAYAKTKTQISFAVTAKLISVIVFATRKVQSLPFLNPKFQVPSYLQWLSSPVCVGPGRKPRRPVFWRRGFILTFTSHLTLPCHLFFILKR